MSNMIFTYENIDRCINTNLTYSLHFIKIIIKFVTEYHIQCCSESRRHIYDKKDNIYTPNRWNGRRCYNRYDKYMEKFKKITFWNEKYDIYINVTNAT